MLTVRYRNNLFRRSNGRQGRAASIQPCSQTEHRISTQHRHGLVRNRELDPAENQQPSSLVPHIRNSHVNSQFKPLSTPIRPYHEHLSRLFAPIPAGTCRPAAYPTRARSPILEDALVPLPADLGPLLCYCSSESIERVLPGRLRFIRQEFRDCFQGLL